jgi:hypothetical protein
VVSAVHFLASLVAASLWAALMKLIIVPLCGHRITWRLAFLFSLIAVFHG